MLFVISILPFESFGGAASATTMSPVSYAQQAADLFAWGCNYDGQVGDGTTESRLVPVQISLGEQFVAIACGGNHSLAIRDDGSLWAWGGNWVGQLGDGTVAAKNAPTRIGEDVDWVKVAAGEMHSLAIKSDGSLWAWGRNQYGQLGLGNVQDKREPTRVGEDNDWAHVSGGYNFTLAVKTDGTLWAWGRNGSSQLGDGTTSTRLAPTRIGDSNDWATVVTHAGAYHAIAKKSDNSLWGWGSNYWGQLGLGDNSEKNRPTRIGDTNDWAKMAVGADHTLALKTDGSLFAWGRNQYGQIGDGTDQDSNVAMQIGQDTDWHDVAAGRAHSLAIKTDLTLWVWGRNNDGQLGDGTTVGRMEPVELMHTPGWSFVCSSWHTLGLHRLSDLLAVEQDSEWLSIVYALGESSMAVRSDLGLATLGPSGSSITWISTDEAVISVSGAVTRPTYAQGDLPVTLIARISKGSEMSEREFNVLVLALAETEIEAVMADAAWLAIGYGSGDQASDVTEDIGLAVSGPRGSVITWSSSAPGVVSGEGKVTRPAADESNVSVTLTAHLQKGSAETSRVFEIVVIAEGLSAKDNSLHGQIVSKTTKKPIEAALINLTHSASGVQYTARTDSFGMFRIRGIEPGVYAIEASHPGYHPAGEPDLVIEMRQNNRWYEQLQPQDASFDVYVEVCCVTTGLQLEGVPVTLITSSNEITHFTDETGVTVFPGLVEGAYRFSVNAAPHKKPGWESYVQQTTIELAGHHWVDAVLKPETRSLNVSVYGFDPVTEQDNVPLGGIIVEAEGVHPRDSSIQLVPTLTGVSGVKKEGDLYWDNSMAGKVRFTDLPAVYWRISGKRLGYMLSEMLVTTDANANLVPDQLTLNMQLEPTQLSVVIHTPYNDPEMLQGLKVRLQGLKHTNTEGIDRTCEVVYDAVEHSARVLFDRLLPGTYLVSVDDIVTKHVPVVVAGTALYSDIAAPANRFSARLSGFDYIDAILGEEHTVDLWLEPEPALLQGRLNLVQLDPEKYHCGDAYDTVFSWVPGDAQRVEIRASEYYLEHMPEEYHLVEVTTDAMGQFSVSLMPGIYGFALPHLDEYWGASSSLRDIDAGSTRSYGWPYYQQWSHSIEALYQYMDSDNPSGGIGGVGLSSGAKEELTLSVREKKFLIRLSISDPEDNTTWLQFISIEGSTEVPGYTQRVSRNDYAPLENGGFAVLQGPEELRWPMHKSGNHGRAEARIEGSTPGTYTLDLTHPHYSLIPSSLSEDTFTWLELPAPGMLPETEFSVLGRLLLPLGVRAVSARVVHSGRGTAGFRMHNWVYDPQLGESRYVAGNIKQPTYVRFEHGGESLFSYNGLDPGPYTVWLYDEDAWNFSEYPWYSFSHSGGSKIVDIYKGGPDPTLPSSPPVVAFDAVFRAENAHNREQVVEGVHVELGDGRQLITPAEINGVFKVDVQNYSHPSWSNGSVNTEYKDGKLYVTLLMYRGISLDVEVQNAETGAPVPGARVRLMLPDGITLRSLVSAKDGSVGEFPALSQRTHLLAVSAEGFEPYRIKIEPEDAVVNPDDPRTGSFIFTGENALKLTPMKKPIIDTASLTMNRTGAFLPGVKKSGNQSVFSAFDADAQLSMSWSLDVSLGQKQYSVILASLNEGGVSMPAKTHVFEDEISEVYLIDRKAFSDHRYDEEYELVSLGQQFEPHEAHQLIRSVAAGEDGYKNMFYQRISDFSVSQSNPDSVRVSGEIKLWQLPPDLFQPMFVVVTKFGAISAYTLEYTGAFEAKELTGARLPAWFASIADVMGTVAGSQAMMGDGLKNVLPRGKIMALPSFTANIVLRPTGALDYVYSIDTQLTEGASNNVGGILGFAPGAFGMTLYGGAEATLKGEDREFYLQLKAGVTPQTVNAQAYTPNLLKNIGFTTKLFPPPAGEFYHIDSYKFDPSNQPSELAVLYGMSAQVGLEMALDLTPVLKYVPKVGPVLYGLARSVDFVTEALIKSVVGVRSLSGFKTTFPHQEEHYAVVGPETNQLRRHFLGGNEVGDPVQQQLPELTESLDIAFGFGMGLGARMLDSTIGARATIDLSGNDAWTGVPSLLIDVNPNGDSPVINRVRGDIRAVLEAYLKAWVVSYRKQWTWTLWPIDYQFGTESALHFIEMQVTDRVIGLGEYAPSEFKAETPVFIDRFFPLGVYSAGEALLYTDANTEDDMSVRLSRREHVTGWSAPDVLAVADGAVVAADVIQLPGAAGWLAAWVEIPQEHMYEYYPPSRIMYSVSDASGSAWQQPQEAALLPDVAAKLWLVECGDSVALVFAETGEGPLGTKHNMRAMLWEHGSWKTMQDLGPAVDVLALSVSGSTDLSKRPVQIAYINPSSELHVVSWSADNASSARIKSGVGHAVALSGTADEAFIMHTLPAGGMGLMRYTAGLWQDLGSVLHSAMPQEISLHVIGEAEQARLVALWTEGVMDGADLCYAMLDSQAAEIRGTHKIADVGEGWFMRPTVSVHGATLHAWTLHEYDDLTQLHCYVLAGDITDITPPSVTDPGMSIERGLGTSVVLGWQRATDDVSAQSALSYRVYYSTSDEMQSVEQIESNGMSVGGYVQNITTQRITLPESETTYYFNVIVRDEAGNRSCYSMSSIDTGLRGDLTNDGRIDLQDLAIAASRYLQHDSACDLNADGIVDLYDLVIIARLME